MKILICCESEIVRRMLQLALEAAGHEVSGAAEAHLLAPGAAKAGALLVEPARARHGIALLRDRGFAGRALLASDAAQEELAGQLEELGADGALALSPPEDLARRFAVALGGRRRVLIVDDSEIAARLLEAELERAGFEILYAPDVETATSLILKRATRPDLMLLDINMPKVSGPQFCRFLKKNDRFRSIKVVFCSGENREKVEALAAECGADGFILKDEFLGRWIVENT
ncbi:MAG TPA: response regulator [Anaeromyxobacteraceae bacterium]